MKKKIAILLLLLSTPFLLLKAQHATMLLKNARIVNVKNGTISAPTYLLIKDGIINRIGERAGRNFFGETHDLDGAYVLPGLINAHIHLGNDPKETWESRYRNLNYLLEHGITSVRDAAGDARILKTLQQDVRSGKVAGPDIYYAAFVAGAPYYKGNDRERSMVAGMDTLYAPWLQCLNPGDDLNRAMKIAHECGATGIKIYGGLSHAELPSLVKAAKAEGLEIWGHATLYPAKPNETAASGIKVLSHAYLLEWEGVEEELSSNIFENYNKYHKTIDHERLNISAFIATMKKNNAIFDPTLYLCMKNGMNWSAHLVKQLHQAGVRICAGTDWIEDVERPFPFLIDEIKLYVDKCGFTPLEALRSATLTAAEVIGQEKRIGSIKKGKNADLLIVYNNPLTSIEHLKSVKMIVKQGKIIVNRK